MLSAKGLGITLAIFWAVCVGWFVLMSLLGIGNVPFDFIDQMYLGWLEPTVGGLFLGMGLAVVDGLVAGLIFAWIYNAIIKSKCSC